MLSNASRIVSAFKELLKSAQICLGLENVRSTETLVAGIAKKSRAILAIVGNNDPCSYQRNETMTKNEQLTEPSTKPKVCTDRLALP